MEFTRQVIRKPFIVEAVEVTEENLEEVALLVGKITEEHGARFIEVDRSKVQGVHKVFPGFWMTKMGKNIRCYNPVIFSDQFCENTPEVAVWVDYINNLKPNSDTEEPKTAKDVIIEAAKELPQPQGATTDA